MIKGICRTTLDDYDVSEVNQFVRVPIKGDYVRCQYKGNLASLIVCQITHTMLYDKPVIIVELTKEVL